MKSANGVGEEERIALTGPNSAALCWSRDGSTIFYQSFDGGQSNIMAVDLQGDRKPRDFVLWLSDDAARIPLRLEVPFGIGDLVVALAHRAHPEHQSTSARYSRSAQSRSASASIRSRRS